MLFSACCSEIPDIGVYFHLPPTKGILPDPLLSKELIWCGLKIKCDFQPFQNKTEAFLCGMNDTQFDALSRELNDIIKANDIIRLVSDFCPAKLNL
jgi:hypothetical protein